MSKAILWIGFIASIVMLGFAALNSQNAKLFPIILWTIIFLGSGYKLFFSQPKR